MATTRTGFRVSFTPLRSNQRQYNIDVRRQLSTYTKGFALEVIEETRTYPGEITDALGNTRLGQYVRTGNLYGSWKLKSTGASANRISYRIENYARDKYGKYYARIVHGPGHGKPSGQWHVHAAHEWINLDDGMDIVGGRQGFRDGAQAVINRALRAQRAARGL